MALDKQEFHVPLGAGLDTSRDAFTLDVPNMASLRNADFDDLGSYTKRKGYTSLSANVFGGGTLTSGELRKLAVYNDELLLFTKTKLYSWDNADSQWVSKGTYLAPKVTERSKFVRNDEQTMCDRAELSNVIVYAWKETLAASFRVMVAAVDKSTGTVLVAPTSQGASSDRPRLVALTSKILLFLKTGANVLKVKAIGPTTVSADIASASFTTVNSGAYNDYYDAVKLTSTSAVVAWRRTVTTSYNVDSVTEALAVTSNTKARACVGPIAVAVTAAGANVAVVRNDTATTILGDILNSSLVDVATASAVATITAGIQNIAAAFRSVADGGQFRCQCFFDSGAPNDSGGAFSMDRNYVDTAGAVGTQTTTVRKLAVATRAFDYNGVVYCYGVFAGASTGMPGTSLRSLQNTYFLYGDDDLMHGKACAGFAGGFGDAGWVHGVANTGGNKYSFCGIEKRFIPTADSSAKGLRYGKRVAGAVVMPALKALYADRGPRDIEVEFDSDSARRTVQIGNTLYIAGGQIMQYDGEGLTEVGFPIFPWFFNHAVSGGAGSIEAGIYTWKSTIRWENAAGELDRCTTASLTQNTLASPKDEVFSAVIPIYTTRKKATTRQDAVFEIWRTLKNPVNDAPFYLVTSKDPTATGSNGYLQNGTTLDSTTFTDAMVDATADDKETNPENNGILENVCPPPASIIAANQDRIFLAGCSFDPNVVVYSKLRSPGEVVSFFEANSITMPLQGGDITALGFLNGVLVVFKESAVYALPGDGFDNFGLGNNYGPPQLLASDTGTLVAETVVLTPQGLMFFSQKGWKLLDRSFTIQDIGMPVDDFETQTFDTAVLMEQDHQVRCCSKTGSTLMYDYVANQWSEWEFTSQGGVIYGGSFHYVIPVVNNAIQKEATDWSTAAYNLGVETPWIKLAGLQGFKRVDLVSILLRYKSTHKLRVRMYFNYNPTARYDVQTTLQSLTVNNPEQFRCWVPSGYGECESIKIAIEDRDTDGALDLLNESYQLMGISLRLGLKKGLYRLPAAQSQ